MHFACLSMVHSWHSSGSLEYETWERYLIYMVQDWSWSYDPKLIWLFKRIFDCQTTRNFRQERIFTKVKERVNRLLIFSKAFDFRPRKRWYVIQQKIKRLYDYVSDYYFTLILKDVTFRHVSQLFLYIFYLR